MMYVPAGLHHRDTVFVHAPYDITVAAGDIDVAGSALGVEVVEIGYVIGIVVDIEIVVVYRSEAASVEKGTIRRRSRIRFMPSVVLTNSMPSMSAAVGMMSICETGSSRSSGGILPGE